MIRDHDIELLPVEEIPPLLLRLAARLLRAPNAAHPALPDSQLMTAKQIAQRFNVPTTWVYERARLGKLPCTRLGRYRRFKLADVVAALEQRDSSD
jgi:excisionase family DNA binding protein